MPDEVVPTPETDPPVPPGEPAAVVSTPPPDPAPVEAEGPLSAAAAPDPEPSDPALAVVTDVAVAPETPPPPVKALVEAVLFASAVPVTMARLKEIVDADTATIRAAIAELTAEYDQQGRSFGMQAIANGWVLTTRPEYHAWMAKLEKSRDEGRLSPAALETLAIIAYRQPINRVNIEAIRGVQSGPLVRALMDKDLVKVVGKEDLPGHPVLYGTTERFLEILGLQTLNDLPKPEDLK